ncbi:hypothetical protein BDV06DRAFT_228521 [Aspergillus oleicola]
MGGSNTDCAVWHQVALVIVREEPISIKYATTSLTDFYSLNPEIDANCTNLWANQSYCVQPVGDISTYSRYGGKTTTSFTFVTDTNIFWGDLPTATPPVYNFTSTSSPYPLASGSLENCFEVFDNT